MPFQSRKPRHALTPRQRREQVVVILAAALARCPVARRAAPDAASPHRRPGRLVANPGAFGAAVG